MQESNGVDGEPRTITQAEYARVRGVSRQAIWQAIRTGRLTAREDGRIELSKADAELLDNTDFSQVRLFAGEPRTAARAPIEPPRTAAPPKPARARGPARTFNAARTEREEFQAQIARMDLDERRGLLVEAAAVRRVQLGIARAARNLLLSLPSRIADKLAAISDPDECRRVLLEEIRAICEEVDAAEQETT